MIVTRLYPGTLEEIDLDDAGSRSRLLELYAPAAPDWLRLNLITTVSGSAAGADGTSESLTNPADRRILGVIRELADVVLVGARSVRSEGYLMPRNARLAVLTASGDLTGHRIAPSVEPGSLVVLCPASAAARVAATLGAATAEIVVVADDDDRIEAATVIAALRERGMRSIVCEGGPSLAAQLAAADLLDEVCLSTSPKLGGGPLPLLPADIGSPRELTLGQLLVDEVSGLYARWLVA